MYTCINLSTLEHYLINRSSHNMAGKIRQNKKIISKIIFIISFFILVYVISNTTLFFFFIFQIIPHLVHRNVKHK